MKRLSLRVVVLVLLTAGAAAAAGGGAEGGHGGDHVPHFSDINWFYGILGSRPGVEPSLLYRPPGMGEPLGFMVLNTVLLFWIIASKAAGPARAALKKRRDDLMAGMDEAARRKAEAEETLARHEAQLEHLEDEVERIQREMKEAGEAERRRILAEATERRARMERDARLLVDQELAAAREALQQALAREVLSAAEDLLRRQVSREDHQRLADEYLASLSGTPVNSGGGRA